MTDKMGKLSITPPQTQGATNVTRVEHKVTPESRVRKNGHKPGVIWLTGLSGSGKSTLAIGLEKALFDHGFQTYVLDGDNLRYGLNKDLGFSPEERMENIRRVGETAALFARAGFIVISAFISPYRTDRAQARVAAGEDFHEVYVSADIEVCEARDPKGLYKRARAGEIPDFTGVSAPYEVPEAPDLVVDSGHQKVEETLQDLLDYVSEKFTLKS